MPHETVMAAPVSLSRWFGVVQPSRSRDSLRILAFAVPPLGDPVEFDHHAIQLQHLFGDCVCNLRRDSRLIVPRYPSLGFEQSQPLSQRLGRDCPESSLEFAEPCRAFHVKPVEKEHRPATRQNSKELREGLVGVIAFGLFPPCHAKVSICKATSLMEATLLWKGDHVKCN